MTERWKPIFLYEGYYEVSNLGRVRSVDRYLTTHDGRTRFQRGVMLKSLRSKNGYRCVCLWRCNRPHRHLIHRLVATAFVSNPQDKPEVNHIDGDKTNNVAANLEWVDESENQRHRFSVLGHVGSQRKLSSEDVHAIRSSNEMQAVLADRYGVTQPVISRVRSHVTYREVV